MQLPFPQGLFWDTLVLLVRQMVKFERSEEASPLVGWFLCAVTPTSALPGDSLESRVSSCEFLLLKSVLLLPWHLHRGSNTQRERTRPMIFLQFQLRNCCCNSGPTHESTSEVVANFFRRPEIVYARGFAWVNTSHSTSQEYTKTPTLTQRRKGKRKVEEGWTRTQCACPLIKRASIGQFSGQTTWCLTCTAPLPQPLSPTLSSFTHSHPTPHTRPASLHTYTLLPFLPHHRHTRHKTTQLTQHHSHTTQHDGTTRRTTNQSRRKEKQCPLPLIVMDFWDVKHEGFLI